MALATLQVVRVELLLCKHALMDEMRHGTITPPQAPEPQEAEEQVRECSLFYDLTSLPLASTRLKCNLLLVEQEVKGKKRKSSGQQAHVLMKVLPPAQVRSLSVMEEFHVVQAQLQQAEDAFTKQVITFLCAHSIHSLVVCVWIRVGARRGLLFNGSFRPF